ncbi:MAG: hypothetical protein QOD41_2895, partial [Cryptosporangiaceae bacterium]|nr:hypothetical protein [Cryptosporangiaceae bacterium]
PVIGPHQQTRLVKKLANLINSLLPRKPHLYGTAKGFIEQTGKPSFFPIILIHAFPIMLESGIIPAAYGT